jgi:hypothetical protein
MVAKPLPAEQGEWTARDRVVVVLIAGVLLAAGLLMTVGGIAVKASAAAKAERLRTNGVVATATLADLKGRNKATMTNVELRYVHEGRQYHRRINCPQRDACDPSVHPTMGIRIDPAQPAEFVADNGATDDSRTFFNSWKGVVIGVFLLLGGGLAGWVRRRIDHPVRRSRRTR